MRYRYDAEQCKRFKTVGLIIEESSYSPSQPKSETIVRVRIGLREGDLQWKVEALGLED